MDIGDWLARLGVSQYEASFRENAIDAEVLRELTNEHLKDLGVPLGHRLKMLRSIRELAGHALRAQRRGRREHCGLDRRARRLALCDL